MNKLSEVARRDIQDLFNCEIELPNGSFSKVYWSGRLDDAAFLSRLYNLQAMPSFDRRFSDAEGDIRCHVGFGDWGNDWVFTDGRFNLLYAEDEKFLRFLCEVFHPAVTRNSVEDTNSPEMYLFMQIQKILRSEGYELYETKRLSNKPVFAWRKVNMFQPATQVGEQVDALKQIFTSDYLRAQIDQMQQAIEKNPTDAIGKAKDLIESCCKTLLEKSNVAVDENWEIPRLIKEINSVLNLMPIGIDNPVVNEALRKLTGNLSQIPYQLATIRNKMGSGHGKSDSFVGLDARHAKLAVGAASTVCWFLWESYHNDELYINATTYPDKSYNVNNSEIDIPF